MTRSVRVRLAAVATLGLTTWLACGPPRTEPLPTPELPPPRPVSVEAPRDTVAPPVPSPAAPPAPDTLALTPAADTAAPVERGAVSVRVCAGGDVMLGNNLDTTWAIRAASRLGQPVRALPDPHELVEPLRALLTDADLVLLNVEGAIGEGAAPPKCRPGSTSCYAFRQRPDAADALRAVRPGAAVVGNIANNHALDAGLPGWDATARLLEGTGVFVTGVDTLATIVPVGDGADTVAVLGFSASQAGPDPRDLPAVRRHVARAATRASRVVVTMHMGAEGAAAQRARDETERYLGEDRGNVVAFAHTAVDAGADVVFGHGPHVLRGAERRGTAVIFYSLGNLLTYGPFSLAEPLNRGAIVCADLNREGQVTEAVIRSTWQRPPGVVAPDSTGRAAWLVDSLSGIDFPATALRWIDEAVSRWPTGSPSTRVPRP